MVSQLTIMIVVSFLQEAARKFQFCIRILTGKLDMYKEFLLMAETKFHVQNFVRQYQNNTSPTSHVKTSNQFDLKYF